MPPVFEKPNWEDRREIVVVDAPGSFEAELATLGRVSILRDPAEGEAIRSAPAFATGRAELDAASRSLAGGRGRRDAPVRLSQGDIEALQV